LAFQDNDATQDTSIKVFLKYNSELTPKKIKEHLLNHNLNAEIKEKSYGLLIRCDLSLIDKITVDLRSEYPYDVFIKTTVPRIIGSHIFSGFLQAAAEYPFLPLVTQALRDQSGNRMQRKDDVMWETPSLNGEVCRSTLRRCKYVTHKVVEITLIHRRNGTISVRCPNAPEFCVWGPSVSCPHGLLEHNIDKWLHLQSPTYRILRRPQ
jgi:hypothetical protein